MNVAIDASRNRSGGAIVHIVELLKNFKHIKQTINELHVWVPIEIANLLKEHKLEIMFLSIMNLFLKEIFYLN